MNNGNNQMSMVILGCGVVGTLAGNRLAEAGHHVTGLRRHPGGATSEGEPGEGPLPGFPMVAGDGADAATWSRLAEHAPGGWGAILVCANPGLRRRSREASAGSDGNRLLAAATLAAQTATRDQARLVLISTTSLYGDANGNGVDEEGPIANDDEARALVAIEQAALAHGDTLVLRATAIVGPTRLATRRRLRAAAAAGLPVEVRGDLDRPFSLIHEGDLAEVVVRAAHGVLGHGVLNAASPERLTVRSYYEQLMSLEQVTVPLLARPVDLPRRWIDSRRLQSHLGHEFPWRGTHNC
jgi:nucleoside-diphosphate-sugar epimerase